MSNIWGFLLQTMTASLTAVILLAVKKLLEDKLSPRWQYGVWIVLVLRMLLPVDTGKMPFFRLALWLEVWKTKAEGVLASAYAAKYDPIAVKHGLPVITGEPRSVTDWLFVIYIIGIVLCLLKYALTYGRLRRLLRKKGLESERVQKKVRLVSEKYHLKPCRAVEIPGLSSAFLCGGFRPVLAVPADTDMDEKILLHELLHFKYYDTLQNIGWCILRALHWCNPFLQYVFHRIGNDMEALCDQRVLERLEGEERRAYGVILLSMANERYARVPGTSSISNGGKNIFRRIASIVRFKKYPKGMALVSVCIVLVLAASVFQSYGEELNAQDYNPKSGQELDLALARTRIKRCSTVAGALDTYAQAMMHENGILLALASPLEEQEKIREEILYWTEAEQWRMSRIAPGWGLQGVEGVCAYQIINLQKLSEEHFTALLSFRVTYFSGPEYDGQANVFAAVPVKITKENGWVVEQTEDAYLFYSNSPNAGNEFEPLKVFEGSGEWGSITTSFYTECSVSDTGTGQYDGSQMSMAPNPDAEFHRGYLNYQTEYVPNPEGFRGYSIRYLDSLDEEVKFSSYAEETGSISGGQSCDIKDGVVPLPAGCKVQLYYDGLPAENVTLQEVSP